MQFSHQQSQSQSQPHPSEPFTFTGGGGGFILPQSPPAFGQVPASASNTPNMPTFHSFPQPIQSTSPTSHNNLPLNVSNNLSSVSPSVSDVDAIEGIIKIQNDPSEPLTNEQQKGIWHNCLGIGDKIQTNWLTCDPYLRHPYLFVRSVIVPLNILSARTIIWLNIPKLPSQSFNKFHLTIISSWHH